MGGIHHAVEPPLGEQLLHLLPAQPSGMDVFSRFQQSLAVLRGHTGIDPDALAAQQLGQFPSLAGAGKNTDFIHPGSLWG